MSDDRTMKIIVYVLLALLLGFGLFVYLNSTKSWIRANNPSTYEYSNGETSFLVNKVTDMGYTGSQIQFYMNNQNEPYALDLRYGPLELEYLDIDRSIRQRLVDDETIFITIDPEKNLTGKTVAAALEITKVLNSNYFFHIPVNSSMTKEYGSYPVKTCSDATQSETVIWLRTDNENSIKADGNCVILTGKTEDDLIKEADRLVLYLLGIMK